MIKILFICHGNICRSPMAEFVMKKLVSDANLADHFQIASAATSTEEIWNGIGNPVYPPAKAELARHGISCEGKRARQVTKADYAEYDYLIGMDSANIRNMLRIFGGDPDGKVVRLYLMPARNGIYRIHGTRESLGRPTMMSWKAVPHFFDIYNKTEESTRKLTLPT